MPNGTIRLNENERALLIAAFATHIGDQLPDECEADGTPERLVDARALADRVEATPTGEPITLTADEARECAEALDSHLYWSISEPGERRSGFVCYEHSDDSAHVEECQECEWLGGRFSALAEQAEQPAPEVPAAWLVKGAKRTECDECGGKGWEHFDTSAGEEIERCDTCCAPIGLTDAHAVIFHRIDCGCLAVPENAPHHPWYKGRTCMPFPTFTATPEDL